MTYRQWIHAIDKDLYGDFAVSDACLDQMEENELTQFVAKLEQMTARSKF